MIPFNLPDLGEGLKEAEIVAWHVAEGDHVVVDQPLVSVETEKAVVEIPSPRSGRIEHFLARPGERIQVGAPLLTFEEGVHPDTGTVVGNLAPAVTCGTAAAAGETSCFGSAGRPGGPRARQGTRRRSLQGQTFRHRRAADARGHRSRRECVEWRRWKQARNCAARGAPWR